MIFHDEATTITDKQWELIKARSRINWLTVDPTKMIMTPVTASLYSLLEVKSGKFRNAKDKAGSQVTLTKNRALMHQFERPRVSYRPYRKMGIHG